MKLRDYQETNSNKARDLLNELNIAYLAMETRTGKTITALSACVKYGAKKILFVTKKKAITSIEKDCLIFDTLDVTVINYESVLKKKDEYDLIVIDEAHSLGTYPKPSKRTKDLKQITTNKPILYLSATPAPESYSQIYHQFYISSYSPFINYINFYKWANIFVDKKIKYMYNREINDYSGAKKDQVLKEIDKYFIRITQKEAGFEKTIKEQVLKVSMSDLQIKMISQLKKYRIIKGKSGSIVLADTAVKLQQKIHQICSGTIKDEEGKRITISDNKALFIKSKFKGKKIAIFYKFIQEFEVLKTVFDNWTNDPFEFQETNKIFLGQFVSSREGIRLDNADCIIFYNIDFSFLSYAQAKDRIVSKERVKEAVLYWVFSNGGIEEKIYKTVLNKQSYTNHIFKKDYGIKNTKKHN